jgi:hypothetical protein
MSTEPPLPTRDNPESHAGYHAPTHGNVAQWVSAIVAGLALIGLVVNVWVTVSFHNSATQSQISDEHIKSLIGDQLKPATSEIGAKLDRINERLTEMGTRIGKLEGRFEQLDELQQIQHSSAVIQPGSGASPKAIGDAASRLKQENIFLPRTPVTETAKSLAQKAPTDASGTSWIALSQILEYISFLNKQSSPLQILKPFVGKDTFIYLPHGWTGQHAWFGSSTYPDVPQFVPIDWGLASNEGVHEGPSFLVLSGAPLILDGYLMKRVILVNVEITYDGGPLQMENVYFVNCTFNIKPTVRSKNLAIAMLSENGSTTFSGE